MSRTHDDHEKRAETMTHETIRELICRADSYLSLLWHRPSMERDVDLTVNVERTIGDLRKAYAALVASPVEPEPMKDDDMKARILCRCGSRTESVATARER
jgi:hypothetical protein